MQVFSRLLLSAVPFLLSTAALAAVYPNPVPQDALIGKVQYRSALANDSFVILQKQYDVGFNAIEKANPHLDTQQTIPAGATVVIPTQHLLPNQPRKGIVVNLPEMRMYYYPSNSANVFTYPIGIGKIGKTIPITQTVVTRKVENPIWIPPVDIREFNLKQGIVLPSIMPAGPDNPLGPYAIYMRVPTYLIHSTIFPESIGKRASFGCIRMYETDIKNFFPTVKNGMPVAIINEPVKTGWAKEHLWIEAHPPLQEHSQNRDALLPGIVQAVADQTHGTNTLVDWQAIAFIAAERDGLPHDVGVQLR